MIKDLYRKLGMKRIAKPLSAGVLAALLLIACGGPAAEQSADDDGFEAVDVGADNGDVVVSGDAENPPVADAQTVDWPEDAPEGFYEALEMGLVMNGYRDLEGLLRAMTYYFDNVGNPLADTIFQQESMGDMDADMVADLELLVRGIDIDVYRVGFVPAGADMGESGTGIDFGSIFGADEEDPAGALSDPSGIIPSGLSLLGSMTGMSVSGINPTGATFTFRFSDGSTITQTREYNSDGTTMYLTITTDTEGETITEDIIFRDRDGNQVGDRETSVLSDETSEADKTWNGNDTDGGDGGGTSETMPAEDSGEGGFCFLFVAPCYNAFLELQSGASGAGLGYVLVNPGQADEQPEASYLSIDPQDLVINPSGEVAGSASGTNRFARFALPVIVLPPRP